MGMVGVSIWRNNFPRGHDYSDGDFPLLVPLSRTTMADELKNNLKWIFVNDAPSIFHFSFPLFNSSHRWLFISLLRSSCLQHGSIHERQLAALVYISTSAMLWAWILPNSHGFFSMQIVHIQPRKPEKAQVLWILLAILRGYERRPGMREVFPLVVSPRASDWSPSSPGSSMWPPSFWSLIDPHGKYLGCCILIMFPKWHNTRGLLSRSQHGGHYHKVRNYFSYPFPIWTWLMTLPGAACDNLEATIPDLKPAGSLWLPYTWNVCSTLLLLHRWTLFLSMTPFSGMDLSLLLAAFIRFAG